MNWKTILSSSSSSPFVDNLQKRKILSKLQNALNRIIFFFCCSHKFSAWYVVNSQFYVANKPNWSQHNFSLKIRQLFVFVDTVLTCSYIFLSFVMISKKPDKPFVEWSSAYMYQQHIYKKNSIQIFTMFSRNNFKEFSLSFASIKKNTDKTNKWEIEWKIKKNFIKLTVRWATSVNKRLNWNNFVVC